MLPVCDDVILKISELLADQEKKRLTMISKLMNKLKHKMIYREKIDINRIINLSYFDNFECIQIYNQKISKYPAHVKYIYYKTNTFVFSPIIPSKVTHLTFDDEFDGRLSNNCVPSSVTHLTFGICFSQPLSYLPSSITHLTFGWNFNRPLCNNIPPSVTHLIFGNCFSQSIKNNIPSSVTHLTFGEHFNHPIKNNIPSSVTHLKFGSYFGHTLDDSIPSSVIEIVLSAEYLRPISENITSRIKIIKI